MKIAIPVSEGLLCPHFGHCEAFTFVDVDMTNKTILSQTVIEAPAHEPGRIPVWIAEQGAEYVIAGGMGGRAIALCEERGVQVCVGAAVAKPEDLVASFLSGTLAPGDNACDH